MKRGQITVGLGALLATGTIVASVLTSYFTTQSTQAEKINNTKESLSNDIGATNERVARLEEAIATLKNDNTEIKRDVKSILQAVGAKK